MAFKARHVELVTMRGCGSDQEIPSLASGIEERGLSRSAPALDSSSGWARVGPSAAKARAVLTCLDWSVVDGMAELR